MNIKLGVGFYVREEFLILSFVSFYDKYVFIFVWDLENFFLFIIFLVIGFFGSYYGRGLKFIIFIFVELRRNFRVVVSGYFFISLI